MTKKGKSGCMWLFDPHNRHLGWYAPLPGDGFAKAEEACGNLETLLAQAHSDQFGGNQPGELASRISRELKANLATHFKSGPGDCELSLPPDFAEAIGLPLEPIKVIDFIAQFPTP